MCYANEESDDVVNCASKIVKYWNKNISWNIAAVFFKLGTRNVHLLSFTVLLLFSPEIGFPQSVIYRRFKIVVENTRAKPLCVSSIYNISDNGYSTTNSEK